MQGICSRSRGACGVTVRGAQQMGGRSRAGLENTELFHMETPLPQLSFSSALVHWLTRVSFRLLLQPAPLFISSEATGPLKAPITLLLLPDHISLLKQHRRQVPGCIHMPKGSTQLLYPAALQPNNAITLRLHLLQNPLSSHCYFEKGLCAVLLFCVFLSHPHLTSSQASHSFFFRPSAHSLCNLCD